MRTEKKKMLPFGLSILLVLTVLSLGAFGTVGETFQKGATRSGLPVLNDTTVLPDVIMMGDLVNFTVNYSDPDGDVGDVRVSFELINSTRGISDSPYHTMSYPAGGNFTEGVEYYYLGTFDLPGTYRYVFNVTDAALNETVVLNGTEFNVILPVPDEGKIYGRITTGEGNATAPVVGADVIIYYYDNETSTTEYYNTTTNATGYYESVLPIVEEPYFMYVNATGFFDSEKFKFDLPTIANELEHDVSLLPWTPEVPEDTTGEMEGIIEEGGSGEMVEGALITIVVYTESIETVNTSGNLTNVTMRTFTNFTDTSDANGTYYIEGITPGKWAVTVAKDGYITRSEDITFTTESLLKNFTLEAVIIPSTYTISGIVDPADAIISFSGNETSVLINITGEFTIEGLTNGEYNLTFTRVGYVASMKSVIINGSDVKLGTIKLPQGYYPTYELVIGPIVDANYDPVVNAIITFSLGGQNHSATTNGTGYGVFTLFEGVTISGNTSITATKDGDSIIWSYDSSVPTFKAAEEEQDEDKGLPLAMIIVVIVVAVVLIIVAIVVFKRG